MDVANADFVHSFSTLQHVQNPQITLLQREGCIETSLHARSVMNHRLLL